MGTKTELVCCTNTLLREIADHSLVRRDVAQTYAIALRSSEPTDWKRVNDAIIGRWSVSALIWIKEQAHSGKCFEN
uniref:Uncharacterized protein n=1 Tax=viral metagenome TaxID=1070528 RepID=A0A6M3LSX4_9ZZZZ